MRVRTRYGLWATAVVVTVTLLAACSSSSRTPAAPGGGPSTTSSPATPTGESSYPAGTRPSSVAGAVNLLDAFFSSDPTVHWYAGGGFGFSSLEGGKAGLTVDVFASTPGAASSYCNRLTSAASYFLQGYDFTLDVEGRVLLASGVVEPAKFATIRCPKGAGPVADPVPASVPKTLAAATERLASLVNDYIGTFRRGGHDAWVFDAKASGAQVTIEVEDATPALGRQRCATLRPLANWILGRFAKSANLRVASGANVSWPTQACP